MALSGKRPCCVCRCWFQPDARVRTRQRACSKVECQTERRRRTQADWVRRNPGYFADRRMTERGAKDPPPEEPRMPVPLNQLPWDRAQDEFGPQGAYFIGVMGRMLLRSAQDQYASYLLDSKELRVRLPPPPAQDQTSRGAQ